jgi:hypothetical protein
MGALVLQFTGAQAAPPGKQKEPAASAAEKPATRPAAQKRTANKPVAKAEKDPRMPAQFNKVITDEQRPKIVAVLKEYAPRLEQVRAELKALTEEREAALLKILTPKQRRDLEELRALAQAKRAAQNATGADEADDEAKPAKTGD